MDNLILMTFILKMIDNALGTLKSIFLQKGRYLISSIFNAASTFFYMVAMVNVIKDNSMGSIIAMCFATFLGSFIPAKLLEKIENDKLYVYEVTTDSFEKGIKFADMVREIGLPIRTITVYNTKKEKVLNCKIYCNTKAESSAIKELISDDYKYHAYVAKDY